MIENLPLGWASPRIDEICDINPRTKVEINLDQEVSFVPMNAVDEHHGKIIGASIRPCREVMKGYTPFREGDVLFAKITPCMENGKAAIARNLTNGLGFGSTEFHVLRPKAVVLAEWLFFILRVKAFRRQAAASFQGAVGQQRVPQSFLEGFKIPLPPISEQRRIVEILQETEEIRRLSNKIQDVQSKLIPSLFDDVFCKELAKSESHSVTLESFCKDSDSIKCGPFGTQLQNSDYLKEGIPLWGIKHVNSNFTISTDEFVSASKASSLKQYSLQPGDIVMTRKGTIGNCAIYPQHFPEGIMHSDLLRIRVDTSRYNPVFISAQLTLSNRIIQQITSQSAGAVMPGINVTRLKQLRLFDTPKIQQDKFATLVSEISGTSILKFKSDERLNDLLQSFLSHAFTGQLTATWRERHKTQLEQEAQARDATLQAAGATITRPSRIEAVEARYTRRHDGAYAELSREQHAVLESIPRGADVARWFTPDGLAATIDGPLRGNRQAIAGHLAVLAARGLVIAASLEQTAPDTGAVSYGNAFRLPLDDFEPAEGDSRDAVTGDRARLREMERLVAQLEKERRL